MLVSYHLCENKRMDMEESIKKRERRQEGKEKEGRKTPL